MRKLLGYLREVTNCVTPEYMYIVLPISSLFSIGFGVVNS